MTYPIRNFNYATIVNVVDGDTCDIELDLGFSVKVTHRFRLLEIDTPERGKPGWKEATDYLKTFVGLPISVASHKQDKYGRYLADIVVQSDGKNINQEILKLGLGKVYGT